MEEQITYENTQVFIPPITTGKVIKVYDGDTITIATKIFDKDIWYRFNVRIEGIDTPEIKTKSKEEKETAIKIRNKLKDYIFNKEITLSNIRLEKYGRLLARVEYNNEDISTWLISNKYAKEYQGGTKEIWKSSDFEDMKF